MPFALIGYFLAITHTNKSIDWVVLLLVSLCMVFARNAAMAFNRYTDRQMDKMNPRTAKREIPAGIIKPRSAFVFAIINSLLFIITTAFINNLVLFLSPVALLIVLGYNFVKKYTYLCHFLLGLGLSLAPIGAYLSVTGSFGLIPVLFSLIVIFWVSGFDIIYALQDEEFDKKLSIKSIPSVIGANKTIILSTLLHLLSTAIVIYIGSKPEFGILYWIGAGIFIALLFFQHLIIRPHDLSKINLAFFISNGIASIVFAFFTILDLYQLNHL
jgi:4-hydroxybenzoate polyprenyltransferase